MELAYFMDSFVGGSSAKDTQYDRRRAEYVLDMLLRSKEVEEAFISAERDLDPMHVRQKFTDRLIDLQQAFNAKETDLGHDLARELNRMVDKVGYFTLLGLMNYLLEHREDFESTDVVRKMPLAIERITGKNGIDSRLLKYHFVSSILPKEKPSDSDSLQKLVEEYEQRSSELMRPNGAEAERYKQVCKSVYQGDYDAMKKEVSELIREGLQKIVRKIRKIEEAQALDSESSDPGMPDK